MLIVMLEANINRSYFTRHPVVFHSFWYIIDILACVIYMHIIYSSGYVLLCELLIQPRLYLRVIFYYV
jgi:hypothetical protein